MKFLAWDTSSKSGSIVAFESEKVLAELTLNVDSTHSERLLWGIHQVLEAARWTLHDVDVFGVGLGPGSFTGLRIGVTTARTLAHTLQKPLVGVSSLAVLARPTAQVLSQLKQPDALVLAATDACKGEWFVLSGTAQALSTGRSLMECGSEVWGSCGTEAVLEIPEYESLKAQSSAIPLFHPQVQGRFLAQLVWEGFEAGLAKGGLEFHPRYLRASNAEVKLRAAQALSASQ
jgi:tRNA threonylcarbamoyl adenosine modification protein YeaZ